MIFIFVEVVEKASGIHPRVAHTLIRHLDELFVDVTVTT